MDVQGGELLVLQGAERLPAEAAIAPISCEVLFAPMYEGQAWFDTLGRHLEGSGYRLFGLHNPSPGTDQSLGHGDAIWVSPAVAARWRA